MTGDSPLTRPRASNLSMALFYIALALIVCSLVMVYSSSAIRKGERSEDDVLVLLETEGQIQPEKSHNPAYIKKQIIWAILGLGTIILFSQLRYAYLAPLAPWLLAGAGAACVAALFFPEINGSHRWIRVGSFSIQPSEFARLSMVLFMAYYMARFSDRLHLWWRGFFPALMILGLVLGVIYLAPDFGAAAVIGTIVFCMWFVGGFRMAHLGGVVGVGGPLAVVALLSEPYRRKRMLAFLDPEAYQLDEAFQAVRSLTALGSGGLTGRGLGNSMEKYRFGTESSTDYIFAIFGEELGLLGTTVLLCVYLGLILIALRVAYKCPDFFGMLVAYGLTMMLAAPVVINIGVATSVLPTKGLALPFMSYGGSSMLTNCAAVGILMNIAAANFAQETET